MTAELLLRPAGSPLRYQPASTSCSATRMLAEGLTEGLGGLATEHLTVKPAHQAGCRLTVRRAAALLGISA